jgi:hypothetical protein
MASHHKFDLLCNRLERAKAVRLAGSDETDEAFSQRERRCDQTNKDNALLNAKSQVVKEELTERLWALMYLQHLAHRVNQTDRVRIYFSNLPPITSLSVHDPESSSSISLLRLLIYEVSIK